MKHDISSDSKLCLALFNVDNMKKKKPSVLFLKLALSYISAFIAYKILYPLAVGAVRSSTEFIDIPWK